MILPPWVLWYSHRIFGGVWNREAGRGREAHQPHPVSVFAASFVFFLITTVAFAIWLGSAPPLESALLKGLAAAACFVAASLGMTYQFANLSLLLWLIDGGYHVARFIVFGLVLGLSTEAVSRSTPCIPRVRARAGESRRRGSRSWLPKHQSRCRRGGFGPSRRPSRH